MNMFDESKTTPLSRLGAFAIVFYSVLFAIEIIMPYVLYIAGYPTTTVGDANMKAILTNIVILIIGYLFGRNEGSKQNEEVISKLVDTTKEAMSKSKPVPDVTIPSGESVTVQAEDK